ncbi:MAG: hypothetical protein KDK53_06545 [Maritimibacter sp.]|nr:hypothetical protein [Maritimibacter sp.]
MEYDYWLYAHAGTADAAVTDLLTSSARRRRGADRRQCRFPRLRSRCRMQADIGVPFHPAATAFFAANGTQ